MKMRASVKAQTRGGMWCKVLGPAVPAKGYPKLPDRKYLLTIHSFLQNLLSFDRTKNNFAQHI
jgi:hypothetical protein